MIWRVDVWPRSGISDAASREAKEALEEAGVASLEDVCAAQVYLIEGDLDRAGAERIARELLHDPVAQQYAVASGIAPPGAPAGMRVILVFRRPGVMDPVEQSARNAITDMGLRVDRVRTGRRYLVRGGADEKSLREAAARVLANEAIEEVSVGERAFRGIELGSSYSFQRQVVPLLKAGDAELRKIDQERGLSLSIEEMRTIQAHFRKLDREPTDVELETLAQTWSEHCKHKTFAADIRWGRETIRNLLKSTIMRATRELARPWCVSVFKDNAGIIEFDDENHVCFKVETHNHPSAIDPYGGANTGIGGVIRDIIGCGLGARPICSTDVFCVGLPDAKDLPAGTIHPRRLLKGVVAGVRDYGNRMGIPTVNGAVFFDERYTGNPLVYCGTMGILPREMATKEVRAGDWVVVVGGRTGRDGIHGATFSSTGLHEKSETVSSGAVQIGNAIEEKRVLDTVLQARDRRLYRGVTDCGAGGLSSAVGEMSAECGAEVDLEKVPLKYEGLSYTEAWISEAQERMVLAVPPETLDEIIDVFRSENVEATVIGRFTGDRKLTLRYGGQTVGSLDVGFLHDGVPNVERKASWTPPRLREPEIPESGDYGKDLKGILSGWNVCSKEWIIRQYDHEVQAGSVVKPLVGVDDDGPGDAAVVRPVLSHYRGLAVACGMNPLYGDLSPYDMAACAIDEAVRNVVCVGGDPDRTALLDNFSWGSPDDPENLGALVLAARACYDAAMGYGTPFISGKDSLNNEYRAEGRRIVIPHSLLISAVSIIEDVRRCVTMDAKEEGDLLYLVGVTRNELGGSHYYLLHGHKGANVPKVDLPLGRKTFAAVARAIREGAVRACHDLSEGGLAAAAAEMAFAGGLGMTLDLRDVPCSDDLRDDRRLFSESASRFLVEVPAAEARRFEGILDGIPHAEIGKVAAGRRLRVLGRQGKPVIDEPIGVLKEAWQEPCRRAFR